MGIKSLLRKLYDWWTIRSYTIKGIVPIEPAYHVDADTGTVYVKGTITAGGMGDWSSIHWTPAPERKPVTRQYKRNRNG